MSSSTTERLIVDEHVRFRRFDEEAVVVNQTTAEVLIVNDVAARLLELTDGRRSIGECVSILHQEFDAPREQIETDVASFVDELLVSGVARYAGS